MDAIESISSTLAPLDFSSENALVLVIAPHAGLPLLVELVARLAINGHVRVLDGGNRFNIYPVAQAVRRLSPRLEETLARISLARAFTCYQMLTLLEETPTQSAPTLVLDLLATFMDENVPLGESSRLLQLAITQLERLSQAAPLIVGVKPLDPAAAERTPLLNLLQASAAHVYQLEKEQTQTAVTLPLFS